MSRPAVGALAVKVPTCPPTLHSHCTRCGSADGTVRATAVGLSIRLLCGWCREKRARLQALQGGAR